MNKNTSISLGNHFDLFVHASVNEGRYKNVSEVIRAGLRLLEENETKISNLKSAIKEGVESDIAKEFNPQNHLAHLKTTLNGKL